jgi:murein DD-endopeptidase MepM/ murein hydrolase activator NlpD
MKRVINTFFALVMVVPYFIIPMEVDAKTVGDLKRELTALEEEMRNNKEEQKLTEQQINNTYKTIDNITVNINQIQIDVKNLNEEIEQLNLDIENKDKEIKNLLNFVQTANGESAYLEYTFGAKSFTDFIYRMAISEQLAKYNKNLIQTYNDMIEDNNTKKENLRKKDIELNNKQKELQKQLSNLGTKLNDILDITVSLEDDIKMQREAIKLYQDELGCKDHEDIKTCGRDKLPPETAFYRPLLSGRVSSNFGNRCFYLNGKWTCDFHSGVDMVNGAGEIPVYAAGKGMVIAINYKTNCGGTMIFIHHNVKGKNYTTVYMHMRSVSVNKGDIVDRNTQIGIMGGDPSREYWDKCTTGQHLHFTIANGLYYKDYHYWNDLMAHIFDPRAIVNLPSGNGYWSDRLTKY